MNKVIKTAGILYVAAACALGGCQVSSMGHRIVRDKLQHFERMKTTRAEVEAELGPPEDTVLKTTEQVTVYVYRWMLNVGLGFGFPLFTAQRVKQSGYQANVMFKDDLFMGYEMNSFDQHLFWRKKGSPKLYLPALEASQYPAAATGALSSSSSENAPSSLASGENLVQNPSFENLEGGLPAQWVLILS